MPASVTPLRLADPLPDASELARHAARCPFPVVLFTLDRDLIIRELVGQLAPLILPDPVGLSLMEIDDGMMQRTRAAARALGGEIVSLETERYDVHWLCLYAPLLDPEGRIVGVIGQARLRDPQEAPTLTESILTLAAIRDGPNLKPGDFVTVETEGPPESSGIWRHSQLTQEEFDELIALNALLPVVSVPAWLRYQAPRRVPGRGRGRRPVQLHP